MFRVLLWRILRSSFEKLLSKNQKNPARDAGFYLRNQSITSSARLLPPSFWRRFCLCPRRSWADNYGPLKTLKGFNRVTLSAGESKDASITLPAESFEFFDRKSGVMTIASGDYKIMYGSSSADKDLKTINITIQ